MRRRRRKQKMDTGRTDRERDTTTLIWVAFGTLGLGFLYLTIGPKAEFSELETILMVIVQMCNSIVCYYFGKQNGQNGHSPPPSAEKSGDEQFKEMIRARPDRPD